MFRYLHRRDRNAAKKITAVIAEGIKAAAIAANEVEWLPDPVFFKVR
jgi:hypothetical protein